VRATPIVLLARRNLRLWSSLSGAPDAQHRSAAAQRVAQYLATHGASFFDEIAAGSALLPTQAEEALGELVALGVVNSDSFAGLRALLLPADRRQGGAAGRRRRRLALFGMDAAGRWSLIARPGGAAAPERALDEEANRSCVRSCAAGACSSGDC
jgi:ATP-dependent Lhr-like helicase